MNGVSQARIKASSSAPGVLRVEGAARILDCTEEFIRTMLRSGELRGFKIGQQWRVIEDAINEFIEHGEKAVRSNEAV